MWESIHPSLNLHIHIPVPGGLLLNILVMHHNIGEASEFEAHVLASSHRSVQIKIFYINCHEFCIECQEDNVEDNLHCGQIHCGCNAIYWIVLPISSYRESGLVGIDIFQSLIHHDSPIRHVPPPVDGDRCFLDEEHCVGPFNHAWNSLCQSSYFSGIGVSL